jgi:hypothetical protein
MAPWEIKMHCENCGRSIDLASARIGAKLNCPHFDWPFVVPSFDDLISTRRGELVANIIWPTAILAVPFIAYVTLGKPPFPFSKGFSAWLTLLWLIIGRTGLLLICLLFPAWVANKVMITTRHLRHGVAVAFLTFVILSVSMFKGFVKIIPKENWDDIRQPQIERKDKPKAAPHRSGELV